MSDKPRVLIVEDEAQIRQFLRLALAAEGCAVLEAGRLDEELALAGAGGIDLVLLDFGLSDGDGIDFIRAYRGWSDGPVLILSARTEERHKIDALAAAARCRRWLPSARLSSTSPGARSPGAASRSA